jgi:hypothetical protein
LRWLSLMLLVDIPWASRVWALPFLTALAPSERYWQQQGRNPNCSPIGHASYRCRCSAGLRSAPW